MKNNSRKTLFISVGAILLLAFIAFLFYYGIPAYNRYRAQKMPHMRVVLEINIPRFLEGLAKDKDEAYYSTIEEVYKELKMNPNQDVFDLIQEKFYEKQIRLSRYYGSIRDSDDFIISKLRDVTAEALDQGSEVISDRLDQYGVFEPSIQKQNGQLIVFLPLESPGKETEERIIQLLGMRAVLEFRLVKDPEYTMAVMYKIDETLASIGQDFSTADSIEKELTEEELSKEHPFFYIARINPKRGTADAYVLDNERGKLEQMLMHPEVQFCIPDNIEFVFSAKTFNTDDGQKYYTLYMVHKYPELTGSVITNAEANIDPNTSAPIVNMEMNAEGTKEWGRITGATVGKRIAVMLDGVVYTAPIVRGKILGGHSQIEGIENVEEAKLLEIVLKAGALPAPFNIVSKEVIEAGK